MIHSHEAALVRVAQLRADAAAERLARKAQRSAHDGEDAAAGAAVEDVRRESTHSGPDRRDWSRAA